MAGWTSPAVPYRIPPDAAPSRRRSAHGRGLHGCLTYEYEHEFWLRVDGSGTVNVTGRPALWTAFKELARSARPRGGHAPGGARRCSRGRACACAASRVTRRGGQALPLRVRGLPRREPLSRHAGLPGPAGRSAAARASGCGSTGSWQRAPRGRLRRRRARPRGPHGRPLPPAEQGLRATGTPTDGVERGNIVGWRQGRRRPSTGGRHSSSGRSWTSAASSSRRCAVRGRDRARRPQLALALWAVVRRGATRPRARRLSGRPSRAGIIASAHPTFGSRSKPPERSRHEHQARLHPVSRQSPVDLLVVVLDDEKTLHEIDDPAVSAHVAAGRRPRSATRP